MKGFFKFASLLVAMFMSGGCEWFGNIPYSVSQNLNGKIQWQTGVNRITFQQIGDDVVILDILGNVIYAAKAPRVIDAVIISEDSNSILIHMNRSMGNNMFNYYGLLRIRMENSKLVVKEVLLESNSQFSIGGNRSVMEIGAISNDGKTALMKVSNAIAQPDGSIRCDFVWETWDLDSEKKMGTGLTLENAKIEKKKD